MTLAVLALVATPILCVSQQQLRDSRRKRSATDIVQLIGALDDFASGHAQQYPQDLRELFSKDARDNPWLVQYRERIPLDAWGRSFVYEPPTEGHARPRVRSYGADGAPGGSGDDEDQDSDSLHPGR